MLRSPAQMRAARGSPTVACAAPSASVHAKRGAASAHPERCLPPSASLNRRGLLAAVLLPVALPRLVSPLPALAEDLVVVDTEAGVGTSPAREGDLVLVHYVGRLEGGDTVFDSTRGGLTYRDGGVGALRPVAIRLGGDPVPGIVAGLNAGIVGMKVGGRRSITVPPALGFGSSQTVLAPYGAIPPGSNLTYDVELLRLSRKGPDALIAGIAGCSQGGQSASTKGCTAIPPAEFL